MEFFTLDPEHTWESKAGRAMVGRTDCSRFGLGTRHGGLLDVANNGGGVCLLS